MPHNDYKESSEIKAKRLQPKWHNAPEVSDLKADVLAAKTDSDTQKALIKTWVDNLRGLSDKGNNTGEGKSKYVSKLIRKQAEWRYTGLSEPFLSTGVDLFNVKPVTFEDVKGSEQASLVLNNQFNTVISKVKFIDSLVRALVDEGTAFIRTGWAYTEEPTKITITEYEYIPTDDLAFIEELNGLAFLRENDPGLYEAEDEALRKALEYSIDTDQIHRAVVKGTREEEDVNVLSDHPTAEVVNVHNITVDPTCGNDLRNAGFLTFDFETSLGELKKSGKYKNLDAIKKNTGSVYEQPDFEASSQGSSFQYEDDARKKLVATEYWGYWDIHGDGTTVAIMAVYVGDTMIMLDKNLYPHKKLPFVAIPYLPVKDSIYGEPDGELLKDNQAIAGAVTRGVLDMMGKSAAGQQGYRSDALSAVNKKRFLNGLDYEFQPNVDPSKSFHTHSYPEIPQSANFVLGQQHAEAESLSGVKAFSSGITGNSLGDTATNGKNALDAASKREMGILRRMSEGLLEVARQIVSMNAEFLSEEEVVRVTNKTFVTVRRDDLQGNYDLQLSISTPEEDDAKAEQLAFMLQTTGQTMGPHFSQLILSKIAKLRKMPDLAKQIEDFQPQPDPLEVEKQQLEIQLLKAKIQNELQLATKNNSSAQLDIARVGTENAKAGNLNSDTDLKDLSFVETESGTTQARTLEVNAEQAKVKNLQSRGDDVKTTNGIRPT